MIIHEERYDIHSIDVEVVDSGICLQVDTFSLWNETDSYFTHITADQAREIGNMFLTIADSLQKSQEKDCNL